ncbi:group II intron maturase-specific domain-containing protein [Streptomyces sioyaensis]|uniref:group II intron maturase-specific domain-containing protein n=1 Tax=Streptomyces sioyaensis TaxID=67364 RepID=UPI0037CF248B
MRTIVRKVKIACRMDVNQPLPDLLQQLNPMLRGWSPTSGPACRAPRSSTCTTSCGTRVWKWIRSKHRRTHWTELSRRYHDGRGWPTTEETTLFDPEKVRTTRYRYRGAVIPSPWPTTG